jgi:hypothetical protein
MATYYRLAIAESEKCQFCSRRILARGMCMLHYYRWERYGNPLELRRDFKPNKGDVKVIAGYRFIYLPDRKDADAHGRVPLSRIVYERAYGVALGRGDHVHYRDGDKTNLLPSNLIVRRSSRIGRCRSCGKPFSRSQSRWGLGKYCSRKCYAEKDSTLALRCKCGKRFKRWPSDLKRASRSRFCSIACKNMYSNSHLRGVKMTLKRSRCGAGNSSAKITEQQAVRIFLLKGKATSESTAKDFGISAAQVKRIWRQESWSHATKQVKQCQSD